MAAVSDDGAAKRKEEFSLRPLPSQHSAAKGQLKALKWVGKQSVRKSTFAGPEGSSIEATAFFLSVSRALGSRGNLMRFDSACKNERNGRANGTRIHQISMALSSARIVIFAQACDRRVMITCQ